MPRILSRNPSLFNSRSGQLHRVMYNRTANFEMGEDSLFLSVNDKTKLLFPSSSQITSRSRTSSFSSCSSEADSDDLWGQFVDTAEAENELIRHSKVLTQRYLNK